MPIRPMFGTVPFPQPQSLMDVIRQQEAEQAALAGKQVERALRLSQIRQTEAERKFREAQTAKVMRGLEHPELAVSGLPEIARQRAHVEALKRAYGADSPLVKEAQADLDLTVHNVESQLSYRKALAEFLPKRGLTTPSRVLLEREFIKAGRAPTGLPFRLPEEPTVKPTAAPEEPFTPPIRPKVEGTPMGLPTLESKLAKTSKASLVKAQETPFGKEDSALLTLYLSKQGGLQDNTKKLSYGAVLEKTVDLITPYRATVGYYSGVEGRSRLAKDMLSSQTTGKLTPQLRDFTRFVEMVTTTLVPQITQYYGLSITEEQQRILREAANPANWRNSPERALVALDTLINTLENEIQVRRDLVDKPSWLTKKHALTAPMYEKIKATGYSLNEIVKKAGEEEVPLMALIDELDRLKQERRS